jgi:hypothetical protein
MFAIPTSGAEHTDHGEAVTNSRREHIIMKRIITLAGIGLFGLGTLAACSDSVDRDGTRDNIVETLEEGGVKVDKDCLDDVLAKYDDDELKDFDDELNDSEPSEAASTFLGEILECAEVGE